MLKESAGLPRTYLEEQNAVHIISSKDVLGMSCLDSCGLFSFLPSYVTFPFSTHTCPGAPSKALRKAPRRFVSSITSHIANNVYCRVMHMSTFTNTSRSVFLQTGTVSAFLARIRGYRYSFVAQLALHSHLYSRKSDK